MKIIGVILIVVGILMFVFRNISFTHEKKVVDLGPLQVSRQEEKTIGWPIYAGGIAIVAGIVLVVADRKRA